MDMTRRKFINTRFAGHTDKTASRASVTCRTPWWQDLLNFLFRSRRIDHTCASGISEDNPDRERITLYLDKCRHIDTMIKHAIRLEKQKPEIAMAVYERALTEIYTYDQQGELARTWRNVRYPINRLTNLLERRKNCQRCLEKIEWYEKCDDRLGIGKEDIAHIKKRKKRVLKMLSLQPVRQGVDRQK